MVTSSDENDGSAITILPLYFGLHEVGPGLRPVGGRQLVVAHVHRHHVEALRDVIAVRVLDLGRHLVEVGRP